VKPCLEPTKSDNTSINQLNSGESVASRQLYDANDCVQAQIDQLAGNLGNTLDADVMAIIGPLYYSFEDMVRAAVESIGQRKRKLAIVLTTPGGIVEVVERMVLALRRHYPDDIAFVIPEEAMSAGTIFAMSGDSIYMDYFSILGPIDPQVQNKDKHLVPALSYLSQYNRLVKKSQKGTLTTAELLMLKSLDLAELHRFEEARELSVELLKRWLAKYKFKNWKQTETRGLNVTTKMREKRAVEIAKMLSDHERWHSHGRPIPMQVLQDDLHLKIEDFGADEVLDRNIKNYHNLLQDFMRKNGKEYLVHTVGFLR
jgi:membrane-bound ClpP family serine protease